MSLVHAAHGSCEPRSHLVLGRGGGRGREDWMRGRTSTLPLVDAEPAPAATRRKGRTGMARTVGGDGAVRAAGARPGRAPRVCQGAARAP